MPFIQFKNGLVRLYHDPRLEPCERNEILEKLKRTPDLLVGVRFYEDEKCYLKNYYEKVVGTEKITAFRAYPASVVTQTGMGDVPTMSKQACMILVAVTGPNHLNELTDEGDIGIVGCYPLSVQPYPAKLPNNELFTIDNILKFRITEDYRKEGYLRNFIASTPLEFQYTMNGVPPFAKEENKEIQAKEFSGRLANLINEWYFPDSEEGSIEIGLSKEKYPTFSELAEITRGLGLNLDGNSLFRLIREATKEDDQLQ